MAGEEGQTPTPQETGAQTPKPEAPQASIGTNWRDRFLRRKSTDNIEKINRDASVQDKEETKRTLEDLAGKGVISGDKHPSEPDRTSGDDANQGMSSEEYEKLRKSMIDDGFVSPSSAEVYEKARQSMIDDGLIPSSRADSQTVMPPKFSEPTLRNDQHDGNDTTRTTGANIPAMTTREVAGFGIKSENSEATAASEAVRTSREVWAKNMDALDAEGYPKIGHNENGADGRAFFLEANPSTAGEMKEYFVVTIDGMKQIKPKDEIATRRVTEFVEKLRMDPNWKDNNPNKSVGIYHPGPGHLVLNPRIFNNSTEDPLSFGEKEGEGDGSLKLVEDGDQAANIMRVNKEAMTRRKADIKLAEDAKKQTQIGQEVGKIINGS